MPEDLQDNDRESAIYCGGLNEAKAFFLFRNKSLHKFSFQNVSVISQRPDL